MDFFQDTYQFQQLCIKYRKEFATNQIEQATETKQAILNLVNFNSERLASYFKLHINKKQTNIDKGKGILLPSMSVSKIISKGDNLKLKDLTSLNPEFIQKLNGINIMLDHSGSMWFTSSSDSIVGLINGLPQSTLRIFSQNFLALVLTNYISKVSRNKVTIVLNAFCRQSCIEVCTEINLENIDTFLPNYKWGNRGEGIPFPLPKEYAPLKFQNWDYDGFCNEMIKEAVNESLDKFKKLKVSNFVSLFFTDGGLNRIGETDADRIKYLEDTIFSFNSISKTTTFAFVLIKLQGSNGEKLIRILNSINIKYQKLENQEDLNNCFSKLVEVVNMVR